MTYENWTNPEKKKTIGELLKNNPGKNFITLVKGNRYVEVTIRAKEDWEKAGWKIPEGRGIENG